MTLEIVIPTLKRLQKLNNCLDSILSTKKDYNIIISVYFSNYEELKDIKNKFKTVNCYYIKEYKVPEFWNSCLTKLKTDALCYLNDDIVLKANTIEKIITNYPIHFPNFDGIVGINQSNLPKEQALESAFGIIGKNYRNYFINNQVWCPDYYRFFDDKELLLFAKYIGKFIFDKEIQIIHLHPAFYPEELDSTHKNARKWLNRDRQVFNLRREKNWLWGRDFNLLYKGEGHGDKI